MKLTPKTIKEWWPVGLLMGGAIALWWTLPQRMAKAEEQIDDLRGWAKEVQGYTRAVQEQTQQQQQQQWPMNAPAPEAHWMTWEDDTGCLECWGYSYEDCDVNKRWVKAACR